MADPDIDDRTLLAHELRSPLGAILAYTEMLIDEGSGSPERAERLLVVRNNVQWLVRLTASMLSRAGAEDDAAEHGCDPAAVAAEIVGLFTPSSRGLGLVLTIEDRTAAFALALKQAKHELPFRQILTNLIGNALKFTCDGGILVGLDVSVADGNAVLTVTVRDTGIGMDEAQVAAVGRPYLQVHADSRRRGGLGLGLTTAKGLAKQLGGELGIRSATGRGSTFTVTIPVIAAPATAQRRVVASSGDLIGSCVLVADDDSAARLHAAVLLKRAGARVTLVADGASALGQACTAEIVGRPFHAILLDQHMPGSGSQLVERLRADGYRGRIIGCSSAPAARAACLSSGMDAFLDKPFIEADLRAAIVPRG